jgi:PAS domain S-box-containing protein
MKLHKLIQKQVEKNLPQQLASDPAVAKLLLTVSNSYDSFDKDRELSERAFEISEEEFVEVNTKLKHELSVKKQSIEDIKKTIGAITGNDSSVDNDDLLEISRYLNQQVTKRKLAEEKLNAIQELWHFALESTGDGVWQYDFNTKEIFFSPQYKKMLGYEDHELKNEIGQWLCRIHPADVDAVLKTGNGYINNTIKAHEREYRLKHKSGKYLWILDRGRIFENSGHRRIIGTHTDITERKKREEEYKRISVVASANENGVLFTDPTGKITWVNEGFTKLTGFGRQEILGQTPFDLCKGPLTDREILKQMVEDFERGRSFNSEAIHYKKDGTWFWGRSKGQALINEDGKVTQYFALVEDVSKEKKAQKKLKEYEEQMKRALSNVGDNYWEHNFKTGKTYFSNPNNNILGYNTDEFSDKANLWWEMTHPDDRPKLEENDRNYKSGSIDSHTNEYRVFHKDGSVHWVLDRGVVKEKDDDGKPLKLIGTHLDITNQKKSEYELMAAREQAESTANAKQAFLANMSHEIRTPMNAILGMSRQFQKTQLTEQQKLFLNTINNAGEHLMVIINDILDISKIDAGKLTLEKIGFSVTEVIKNTVEVMQHRASEKGLLITYHTDKNVADVLKGDPYRLKQVLLNLASNSIKFSEKGVIKINCRLKKQEGSIQVIELSVADEGIGMDKEFIGNIFQSFTQEDRSVTRKFGGTGLGMTITKQLTELMGGSILVESEKGVGTTITLCIPLSKGTVTDLPAKESTSTNKSILIGKKILLVEDNEVNRLVATNTLGHYKAVITEAVNGQEAVDILKNSSVDIVLMDMQMPVMDGIEATKVIRTELNSNVPIIALTANAIKGESDKCFSAGMNDFISKPFAEEELISVIAKWLAKSKNSSLTVQKTIERDKLFDLTKLTELSKNDTAFMEKIISLFITQAASSIQEIQVAMSKNDFAKIKAIAHKIKPAIDNMGIFSLKTVVNRVEELAAKNCHSEELTLLLGELENTLNDVIDSLQTASAA